MKLHLPQAFRELIPCKLLLLIGCFCCLQSSFGQGRIAITEYMYDGKNGEFIEFSNVGDAPVDMTGWSFDDDSRTPGSQSMSAYGVVQAGESVILTDVSASTFRTAWNLCSGVKIIGGNINNLGRADEINLYNASNTVIDRLTYGDQTYAGTIRTSNISGYVNAAGLGTNMIAQWKLSATGDGEGSYKSTGGDIGSPGKSTRVTVTYNPCSGGTLSAPTIAINTSSTTNFIDGGITSSPASPFTVSGVISDSTDPAGTYGIDFIIGDDATAVSSLLVTASSSNTSVVPSANLTLSGSGAVRNLKIQPVGIGYSTIKVMVNDGSNTTTFIINYAASASSSNPAITRWHTGMSDASDAISLDDNYFISGDDELDILNVYSKSFSGLPVASYNYSSYLSLPEPAKPEVDVEAGVRSTTNSKRIYWLGSMSNGKDPFDNKPNRDRIFATDVNGTGAATTFSVAGYGALRSSLIAWGDANGYNFSASAAAGADSKSPSGFAAEGMVFGPDNTTLFIGMRAPLVPTASRTKAVIAPILNFETWFNNGSPIGNPAYGSPVELDLGQRGIRDLIRLSNGTYIIIAGNPAGDSLTPAIYKWTGKATDAPIMVSTPDITALNAEGALEITDNGDLSLSKLRVLSDLGDNDLYNDGNQAKDFSDLALRKFRSDSLSNLDLSLCQTVTSDTTVIACDSFTWYDTTYTAMPDTAPTHTFTNTAGCDSIVTLHLTINHSTSSTTTVTANNSYIFNGVTYTTSGTYKQSGFNNAAGCDSTAVLVLTINKINSVPIVKITSPVNNSITELGTVTLQAQASDTDGRIVKVEFFNYGVKFAEDTTSPYGFTGTNIEPGTYLLTAKATDDSSAVTISDTVHLTITSCSGSGSILAEGYVNIPGSQVADLLALPKYPGSPDVTLSLNSFEYGQNYGDNYGARVRGYICPPVTGAYTFYIAGDDQAGLYLSTDDDTANKTLIAYNESAVRFRAYNTYSTQKSAPINLVKGKRYYIETLHKEATANDHLSVAWQIPGGAFEGPITGSRLSPYNTSSIMTRNSQSFGDAMTKATNAKNLFVSATPNPATSYFTVSIKSVSNEPVSCIISDMAGRILERKSSLPANKAFHAGSQLPAGIYLLQVIQGSQKKILKIAKQ